MTQCISCGMPLEDNTTSKHRSDICLYCQDQDTGELKTYDQVRAGSIDAAMRLMGKTEAEATVMAGAMLPSLPR